MKTAQDVLKAIRDQDIKYVDFRFTDPRGKWQHVTFDVSIVDEEAFAEGVMFDGSSIAGWKAINESDMMLMPDPTTAAMDPFFAAPTLSVVCDVLEPSTGEPYSRDPRGVARKGEAYAASAGIGDSVYFGPEAEFFVFDDVRVLIPPTPASYSIRPSSPATPTPLTRAATSATASAPRAATFRYRPRIRRRTCAVRCWRQWRRWARRSRSTITRWPRRSTSSASSSAR